MLLNIVPLYIITRNRILNFILIISTIALGLASRTAIVPDTIYPYLGDILYAVMIYFVLGFLLPTMSQIKVAIACVLACFAIEFLQLIDVPWLNSVRNTLFGRLVLGSGFLWSDLLCYLVGTSIGFFFEKFVVFNVQPSD